MKTATTTARKATARKAVAFDYVAFEARLVGAIVGAETATANVLDVVLELRGNADADKARELFKAAYVAALSKVRGEPVDEKDTVVKVRVADCMAIFNAPELPADMSRKSVQNAAKACREAAKGEDGADKKKREPRQPVGKGEPVTASEALAIALELARQEACKLSKTKQRAALTLVAELSDLIDDMVAALAK